MDRRVAGGRRSHGHAIPANQRLPAPGQLVAERGAILGGTYRHSAQRVASGAARTTTPNVATEYDARVSALLPERHQRVKGAAEQAVLVSSQLWY